MGIKNAQHAVKLTMKHIMRGKIGVPKAVSRWLDGPYTHETEYRLLEWANEWLEDGVDPEEC